VIARMWQGVRRRVASRCVSLCVVVVSVSAPASADITLGVFAPAAHFANTQERLEMGQRLADHLSSAVPEKVKSRVYARAADFEKAVSEGAIELALVDATYLAKAKGTGYRVIAMAPEVKWQLVSSIQVKSVAELKGKRLRLASAGGSDKEERGKAIARGLFGGEAEALFGSGADAIAVTQDSASALAALSLGKAEAALVPVNPRLLRDGMSSLLTFEKMPGVVLIAYGDVFDAADRIAAVAAEFSAEEPVLNLKRVEADDDVIARVRQRLEVAPRRAPLPTLPLRALIDSLVQLPVLSIPQRAPQELAQLPDGKPAWRQRPPNPVAPAAPKLPDLETPR
jgi:hypothetical protein